MVLKVVVALLGLLALTEAKVYYDNYKVYSVIPNSEEQVQILTDLRETGYEFWTDSFKVGSDVRIMVSPSKDLDFVEYSKNVGFDPQLRIANVQKLIDAQMVPAQDTAARSTSLGSFNWLEYHNLAEIHAWLDELQAMYPDVVSTVTMGNSTEGNPIKGVIINFNSADPYPLVGMIEGGIHSREWISPATVTWIVKEFLTSEDPDVRFLAEAFVWHIFPVVNPDGYLYTFSENRMWRKNRNPANFINCYGDIDNDLSNGIDLNRNFDFLWMTIGASNNPCAQDYAGPSPASELEAQAISNYVRNLKGDGKFLYYFAFHSYSQLVLIPYSHARGYDVLEADNYADLYEISIRGAEKLAAVNGTDYRVGTSAEVLYEVSGSSFDWVKGVANIPIVLLFELRDLGENGFLLPADQIIPNNDEIMACLVEMDKTARMLNYYQYQLSDSSDSSDSSAAIASPFFASIAVSSLFLMLLK